MKNKLRIIFISYIILTNNLYGDNSKEIFKNGFENFQNGNYTKSLELFLTIQNKYQELDDYILFYLSSSYFKLGVLDKSKTLSEYAIQKYPYSLLIPEFYIILGNILYQSENYREAIPFFEKASLSEKLFDDNKKAYANFRLASCYEKIGDYNKASFYYQQVYWYFPYSDFVDESKKRWMNIITEHNIKNSRITAKMYMEQGEIFFSNKDYNKAIEVYKKLLAEYPGGDFGKRALFKIAQAYLNKKCYSEAEEYLKKIAKHYGDSETQAEVLYQLAEITLKRKLISESKKLFEELIERFPQSEKTDDALWELGHIDETEERYQSAVNRYLKIVSNYPKSEYVEEVLWRAGWNYYLSQKYVRAKKTFDDLIKSYPESDYIPCSLYWGGRSSELLDDRENAISNYKKLIESYRDNYYGILALNRYKILTNNQSDDIQDKFVKNMFEKIDIDIKKLQEIEEIPEKAFKKIYDNSSEEVKFHLIRAKELANIGLKDLIKIEVRAIFKENLEDIDYNYLFSIFYNKLGDYLESVKLANKVSKKVIGQKYGDILNLSTLKYPLDYWEIIKEYSDRNNLDPFLVAGIIRQESVFDPKVVSKANAIGLMQIIPSTGELIARQIKLHGYKKDNLYHPEINISMGSWFFKYLLKKFEGDLIKAVASYNAGEGSVQRWWTKYKGMKSDEIAELIPYKETRLYVKLVLRNYINYREIYGNSSELK